MGKERWGLEMKLGWGKSLDKLILGIGKEVASGFGEGTYLRFGSELYGLRGSRLVMSFFSEFDSE
jgi:hypothetical protein